MTEKKKDNQKQTIQAPPGQPPQNHFPVVGIGASAGGLAALESFFSGLPADTDPDMAKAYLPIRRGMPPRTRPNCHGRGERVLLVEDDPPILKLAHKILDGLGYGVLSAGSIKEALDLAENHPEDIHLLVTDVIMPEMNGRDLERRIRLLFPGLKSLFMSGYSADIIARHGVLDPDLRFIQKPFSKTDLATAVRQALDA